MRSIGVDGRLRAFDAFDAFAIVDGWLHRSQVDGDGWLLVALVLRGADLIFLDLLLQRAHMKVQAYYLPT